MLLQVELNPRLRHKAQDGAESSDLEDASTWEHCRCFGMKGRINMRLISILDRKISEISKKSNPGLKVVNGCNP